MPSVPTQARHRRRPMHPETGMTLIEVVVAVTLLGLLSTGLVMSFQMGVDAWRDTRDRLTVDRRIATANQILNSALVGMIPIKGAAPDGPDARGRRFLFFQGEPHSMRFVTSFSVTEGMRGGLQVIELQVVSSPGGRRILLNQSPFMGPLALARFVDGFFNDPDLGGTRPRYRPIVPYATSLVIVDELEDCSFWYLERPRGRDPVTTWLPVWTKLRELPEAVAINVLPRIEGNRLRPVSLSVPVPSRGRDPQQGAAARPANSVRLRGALGP